MKKVYNNNDFFKSIIKDLEKGDKVSFLVKGNSMLPFLIDGKTEVFLERKCQLKRYDICLFQYNDKFVLHRLIGVKKDKFIYRGDNSYGLEYVSKDNIYACVYQYITNGKTIKTNKICYKLKVRCFMAYKGLKRVVRKILKR
jgi:hypothetical protein